MRPLIGFVAFHGLLIATGLALLRALGLLTSGWRAAVSALGPALLAGASQIVLVLIVLLVLGVPLTLGTTAIAGVTCATANVLVAARRRPDALAPGGQSLTGAGVVAAATYCALGALAVARAPARGDDARIWSLKGLTLTYYGRLRPEIFHNPLTAASHPIYPLFQPMLEAGLNRAVGTTDVRLFHAELWLLFGTAIWTAAYLLWWRCSRPGREQLGVIMLALLAITPAVWIGVWGGDADVTASMLLGTGALALALWIGGDSERHLGLATVLLAAAANTKDEELVGVPLVLLAAAAALILRGDVRRLRPWSACAVSCAVLIVPWRLWVAEHHLTDSVIPALPRALSPVYLIDRLPQFGRAASAMLGQVVLEWGWLLALFIAICAACLVMGIARRLVGFYVGSFAALVAALLWLYTTTPISLGWLIRTSMDRTVGVFMALTPFASAHLATRLMSDPRSAAVLQSVGHRFRASSIVTLVSRHAHGPR